MENVVLTIHLILAVLLTGVVLLQRSEGGGLGMGGGGGVMTGRQAANALTRLTWLFGIALFCTSIALTVIAAQKVSTSSIMDQLGMPAQSQQQAPGTPSLPTYTPPPTTGGDPLTPPAPDAAAPAAPAETTEAPAAAEPPAAEAPAEAPAEMPAETGAETAPAESAPAN